MPLRAKRGFREWFGLFLVFLTLLVIPGWVRDVINLGLLNKGMQPEMARLTLARKIAAITLKIWKKGEAFNPEHLKSQAA